MRTIEIKLYSFEELSEAAQAKAIEQQRKFNDTECHSTWSTFILSDWQVKLSAWGFNTEIGAIKFCGFGSQGDGACFDCKDIDLEVFCTKEKLLTKYRTLLNTLKKDSTYHSIYTHTNCTRYLHSHTRMIDGDLEVSENHDQVYYDNIWIKIVEDVQNKYYKLCDDIYRDLQEAYWHSTSDESVKAQIIANDYEFNEDGTFYS